MVKDNNDNTFVTTDNDLLHEEMDDDGQEASVSVSIDHDGSIGFSRKRKLLLNDSEEEMITADDTIRTDQMYSDIGQNSKPPALCRADGKQKRKRTTRARPRMKKVVAVADLSDDENDAGLSVPRPKKKRNRRTTAQLLLLDSERILGSSSFGRAFRGGRNMSADFDLGVDADALEGDADAGVYVNAGRSSSPASSVPPSVYPSSEGEDLD